jgi:tetratricopeptide (TPR) repeat protein
MRYLFTALAFSCLFLSLSCQSREAYRLAEAASIHERTGKFQEAVATYERALAFNPDDPYLLTRAGLASLSAGNPGAAISYLAKARDLAPDYLDALRGLAQVYVTTRDTQQAIEALGRLSALSTGDPDASLETGLLYRSLGHPQEALKALEEAAKADPDLHRAHAELGVLYYERRDYEAAERAYEAALRLNPYDARTLNNLAWLYAEQGRQLDRALDLSLLSLRRDADQPAYLDTLAEICYRKGDYRQAVALIRRAIALAPDAEHYRKQLRKFLAAGQKV